MVGASEMKLVNYQVLKTSFELNTAFVKTHGGIIIHPSFHRNVRKIDESNFSLEIGAKVCKEQQDNSIPFYADVIIQGFFEFKQWDEQNARPILIDNATAILFPYLRNLLATLTLNGNIPPYTLPIMNVSKLFASESIIK